MRFEYLRQTYRVTGADGYAEDVADCLQENRIHLCGEGNYFPGSLGCGYAILHGGMAPASVTAWWSTVRDVHHVAVQLLTNHHTAIGAEHRRTANMEGRNIALGMRF